MYKVIVVEDEKLVRQGIIFGTNWSQVNCMVVGEAEDGETGIAAIRKYQPDLVVTDICMPKMNGIEMIQKLQEENINPVVIFLTAYDEFSYAQQAVKLGAVDYLLKPFEDGELEAVIGRIFKKSSKHGAGEEQKTELAFAKGDKSKYIMDAIAYIEENYADPDISIKAAAQSMGISEGHLSHLFRKETDFTFLSCLTQCRMRAAKNLLKDYHYKVYEVAELVGYHDITYFSVTFKRFVGVSPSEYQDRFRA